jgi:hypothetical protein
MACHQDHNNSFLNHASQVRFLPGAQIDCVGGFIAQLLALDHPDQVASLT